MNCGVMIVFIVLFDIDYFKRMFNGLERPVKDFLLGVSNANVTTAKDRMNKMQEEVTRRKSNPKISFFNSDNLALSELGIE